MKRTYLVEREKRGLVEKEKEEKNGFLDCNLRLTDMNGTTVSLSRETCFIYTTTRPSYPRLLQWLNQIMTTFNFKYIII